MSNLKAFSREHQLSGSHFTGIGAFQDVMLGYFVWAKKDYKRIPISEQVEVVSLVGDITQSGQSEPTVHAHVVLGKSDGTALFGCLRVDAERSMTRAQPPLTGQTCDIVTV